MIQDIWTILWRDWLVLRRRLGRYLLSRMVAPLLYLTAFGWGVGRSLPAGSGNYLDFIVPGIAALNAMNVSFHAVATPLLMSRLYHKTLEEYLMAPISEAAIVLGKVLSGVVRGLLSSVILLLTACVFGAAIQINAGFLLVLIVTCAVFAALAVIAAMCLGSHEELSSFGTYVLMPMSFLCATFFKPIHFPVPVRQLVELLPLTHASQALRNTAGGADIPAVSLLILCCYLALFLTVGIWLIKRVRD